MGEHDFTRAYNLIWNASAQRAAHQQRFENLVQTAGFLGKTKVEEVRRSARAKIHCIFNRDFKIWSLAILRKKTDRRHNNSFFIYG
jgi:pyruvate-formate lyase-activating enzyme